MKRSKTFLTKAAMLLIVALFSLTGVRAETLTVHNGTTTNNIVPVYGNWVDNYSKSQFIIASSDLDKMFAGSITGMTFYASQSSSSWGNAKFDVYLSEVSETTISALKGWDTLTKVYSGSLSISGSQMTITFNTPYNYLGGNLLVGINETNKVSNYSTSSWYGETVTGASVGGYSTNANTNTGNNISQRNFIPKTTFTYTPAPQGPTNVTVSNITPTTANVSWDPVTGATGYVLQYAKGDYSGTATLSYDNGIREYVFGPQYQQTQTWGVMYPASQVTYSQLTKVSIFETAAYNTRDITINIYSGGDTAPGTLLHTETVATEHADAFHEVTFATPVAITPGENLWITLTETGTYVKTLCNSTEVNNQWIYFNNKWVNITESSSSSDIGNYGWMIRAEINDLNLSTDWTTVTQDITSSSYELTGLDSDTHYLVRVRALYDGNASSVWSEISSFTTLESNPTPIDVAVVPSYTSANISWTGYATSYEVKYRKVSFFDDFENGLDRWTIYTEGEHPDGDDGWVEVGGMAASYSWHRTGGPNEGETLNANNWLVTPEVELGGTLSFWAYSGGYADEYEVLLSTTGNDTEDFTIVLKPRATPLDSGDEVSINLSTYEGQTGYIAIHHVYNGDNGYFIDIDNFEITSGSDTWKTATTNTSSIELTGLEPGTEYEFIITGKKSGSDDASTALASFTTKAPYVLENDKSNAELIESIDGETCWIVLKNRTLKKNGNWNTLCLPFNVELTGDFAGADVRTLDTDATVLTDDHLKLKIKPVNTSVLYAGTPYLIRWQSGDDIVEPLFANVTVTKAMNNVHCDFDGGKAVWFKGNYESLAYSGVDQTVLFISNNKLYYVGNGSKIYPHRAYFKVEGLDGNSIKQMVLDMSEDDPDGINDLNANFNDDESIYNVAGQRLGKMQKGINIVNGKKIIVK